MNRSLLPLFGFLPVLVLAPACGGGGGGQEAAVAPTVVVTSPSVGGVTDERELTLRGTADPGSGTVADVRVAGKSAATSDGFATWTVTVPLQPGVNAFTVVVEDGNGGTTDFPVEAVVERVSPLLLDARAVAIDAPKGRAFVVDRERRELLTVDLTTGERKVVSGPELGGGPLLEGPLDVVLDAAAGRVLVLDVLLSAVVEVDLLTGDRAILAATSPSDSPTLTGVTAIASGGPDRLLAASVFSGVLELELSTGKLLTVSDDEPGLGPPLASARGVAHDSSTDTAYVTDISSKDVFQVDVPTGKRVLLSEGGVAPGPPLGFPAACELDAVNGLVVADLSGALVAVDLVSGARTAISNAGVGGGEPFGTISDVALEAGDAFVPDIGRDVLVRVDLATGDRSSLGGESRGFGPFLASIAELSPSPDGRILATINATGADQIVAVDPLTGTRQIISGNGVGLGDAFFGPLTVDIHPQTFEILVVDSTDSVLRVLPQSGARQVILGPATQGIAGVRDAVWLPDSTVSLLVLDDVNDSLVSFDLISGGTDVVATGLVGAADLEIDPIGNRAIVAAGFRIYAVDLATGTVETLTAANDSFGGGEPFDSAGRIAVDGELGVVYMRDDELDTILSVDLASGQRTLVADRFRGDGLELDGTGGLSLSDDGRTLFAYHSSASAILAVTIASGDRFVVAR